MQDKPRSECCSCHATAVWVPVNMFSQRGHILWTKGNQQWIDDWFLAERGYMPTLCNACAAQKCYVCHK